MYLFFLWKKSVKNNFTTTNTTLKKKICILQKTGFFSPATKIICLKFTKLNFLKKNVCEIYE